MSGHFTWVDGVERSHVPVSDRGLAYGDGLFETIRITEGQPTLIELHLDRLQRSAFRLGIEVDIPALHKELGDFLTSGDRQSGIAKVIVTRGSGGRGYNPRGCNASTRIFSFHELPDYGDAPATQGIRLYKCKTRLGQTILAGLKHLNRLESVLARAEWQAGENAPENCLEGLLLDFDGRLVEGTMSNLFFVHHKTLKTPSLNRCGVEGVARTFILQQAENLGVDVQAGDFSLPDLSGADEVFVCNSVNGVWPVVSFEDLTWKVGAVTLNIRDRLLEVLNG